MSTKSEIEDGFGCAGLVPSLAEKNDERRERHQHSCISYVSRSPSGKASTVYLRDGTMITIGRERETQGAVWLDIREQGKIIPASAK